MNNFSKYRYLGNVQPEVPESWKPIILRMLKDIDSIIRPWYMPRSVLNRMIGEKRKPITKDLFNQVIDGTYVDLLVENTYITTIKQKFASLRISGTYPLKVEKIINKTEELCNNTCEFCGNSNTSTVTIKGWVRNLCVECKKKAKE